MMTIGDDRWVTRSGLTNAYRSSVRTTWLPDLTARPVSAKPAHASNRFAIWRIAPSGFVARYCKRLSLSLVKSRSFFRPEKKQTQDFGLLRFLADSLLANRSAFVCVCVIVFNIHHPSSEFSVSPAETRAVPSGSTTAIPRLVSTRKYCVMWYSPPIWRRRFCSSAVWRKSCNCECSRSSPQWPRLIARIERKQPSVQNACS